MLFPTVSLEARMSAFDVLARLARYGLWVDSTHPATLEWIQAHAQAANISFGEMAERIAREPDEYRVAIRRQYGSNVLWYMRPAVDVLLRCAEADPKASLLDVMDLHERDSIPATAMSPEGTFNGIPGVLLIDETTVVLNIPSTEAKPGARRLPLPEQFTLPGANNPGGQRRSTRSFDVSSPILPAPKPVPWPAPAIPAALPPLHQHPAALAASDAPAPQKAPPSTASKSPTSAWPRVDAPTYVPAGDDFEVRVGFAAQQVRGTAGGPVVIDAPAGLTSVEIDVDLVADGIAAVDGWSRKMTVELSDPTKAEVTFVLKGNEPTGPEPVHLTTLEVRYLYRGSVCGVASRALVVGHANAKRPAPVGNLGIAWESIPSSASAVTVGADPNPADLTIEILKPDRNDAGGRFVCRLYSPHALQTPRGPFDIDLGQDAKTFAKETIEDVRLYAGSEILENAITARARLVADRLPAEAIDALREVAHLVAPSPPAVLIVSAEPYVPWELAAVDPPLDPGLVPPLPPYLGAQAIVGRWLRDGASTTNPSARVSNPPVDPPSSIGVKNFAVMVGLYDRGQGGFVPLPFAKAEGDAITLTYKAVALAASVQSLKQLLDAKLEQNFEQIGGADAIHFAGHGEFDTARKDSSVLYMSNGTPMSSLLFRSANYGGACQPLMFMNACMIGQGDEVLGSAGGFPGNCLKGGFGAFIGALWEVDDSIAHDIALQFWQRALPTNGSSGEPIGMILRDLRAKYVPSAGEAPESTYLAYVYYGHPRLTLRQAA